MVYWFWFLIVSVAKFWNCLSTSFLELSWRPYVTAILFVVLHLSLIHRLSILVSVALSAASVMILFISFHTGNPTPPSKLFVLFVPIYLHVYPSILTVSSLVSWVSVMPAMWAPCVWSADVRVLILLLMPLVLMVSNLSSWIVLVVLFLFPLFVQWLCCAIEYITVSCVHVTWLSVVCLP